MYSYVALGNDKVGSLKKNKNKKKQGLVEDTAFIITQVNR